MYRVQIDFSEVIRILENNDISFKIASYSMASPV
jgi:hypothetical protein